MPDLNILDTVTNSESGVEFELVHPVRGGIGVFITVYGPDSKAYTRANVAASRIALRGKKSVIDMNFDEMLAYMQGQLDASIEKAAFCTAGWREMEDGGEPVEFSVAKAKEIYAKYPLICGQVLAFMERQANFLPKLESNSPDA